MSFLGGAECSTAGNPLSQFTKHVQDDKSLQRDRLVEQGPRGLQESFRSQVEGANQDEVGLGAFTCTWLHRVALQDARFLGLPLVTDDAEFLTTGRPDVP